MDFYEDDGYNAGEWDEQEWPEGWDYLVDEQDWEVFDIEIGISYGEDA
jgi:hypothetical protein